MRYTPARSMVCNAGLTLLLAQMLGRGALAQTCEGRWVPGYTGTGVRGAVYAVTTWDPDGAGPAPEVVVVGGNFERAGEITASRIAAWNPKAGTWSRLGTGLNGDVYALAILPNGRLVAGGYFTSAGGVPASYLAQWDGESWSSVGASTNHIVHALLTLPNGDLFAAGEFDRAGGVSANKVARWDGVRWWSLANGEGETAFPLFNCAALAMHELPGNQVLVAGCFGDRSLWKWDGAFWTRVTMGVGGAVECVVVLHDGQLAIGGSFRSVTGVNGDEPANYVARWNGVAWQPLGSGMNDRVRAVIEMPSGDLLAAGMFTLAGANDAHYVARWRADAWQSSSFGNLNGTNGPVLALASFPSGDLVAGGEFTRADGWDAGSVARLSGLTRQPASIAVCPAGEATFTISAVGIGARSYQWQCAGSEESEWQNLQEGFNTVAGAAGLQLSARNVLGEEVALDLFDGVLEGGNRISVRCVVRDECGSAMSETASLTVCPVDVSCDGFVDFFDYDVFVEAFELGDSTADFNRDGFLDFFDYDAYVGAFERGC